MIMCEPLEGRRLMSATLAADVEPEAVGMLVPAVQSARLTTTDTTGTTDAKPVWPGRTGPIADTLSSAGGNASIVQLQLVVM